MASERARTPTFATASARTPHARPSPSRPLFGDSQGHGKRGGEDRELCHISHAGHGVASPETEFDRNVRLRRVDMGKGSAAKCL